MQTQPPPIVDIEWTVVTPATEAALERPTKQRYHWAFMPIRVLGGYWLTLDGEDTEVLRWFLGLSAKVLFVLFTLMALFGAMAWPWAAIPAIPAA